MTMKGVKQNATRNILALPKDFLCIENIHVSTFNTASYVTYYKDAPSQWNILRTAMFFVEITPKSGLFLKAEKKKNSSLINYLFL